jgi:hypothetical protein
MVIGDYLGYSSYAQRSYEQASYGQAQRPTPARPAVTLDAEPDPKTPNQYIVQTPSDVIASPVIPSQVIPPPEQATEAASSGSKTHQNTDPVSRAFLAVENYQPTFHRIDISV